MRRTHTKSRKGCTNCKRRKVKCDEAYPICFNCKRHQTPCSLSVQTPDSPEHGSRSCSGPPSPTPQSVDKAEGSEAASPATAGPPLGEQIAPFPPAELWNADIELMHHYMTITADSMSLRQDLRHVWRVVFPREGYQHSFVMHGILAVSATHKALLLPNMRQKYLSLSDYHHTVGSEGFRFALQKIDASNKKALFGFASIMALHIVALPIRCDKRRLPDPIHNFMEVLGIFRGLNTTLSPLVPGILRNDFAPLKYGIWQADDADMQERYLSLKDSLLPLDTWEAVDALRDFQKADLPSSSCADYLESLDHLDMSTKLMAVNGVHVEVGAVLMWIYLAKESVLLDIGAHRPHGLLMLAYFCVHWATLDKSFWYTRGWPRQLFDVIEAKLIGQKKYMDMLEWPRRSLLYLGV